MKRPPKYLLVTSKGKILEKFYYKLSAKQFLTRHKLTYRERLYLIRIEELEEFRANVVTKERLERFK